MPLRHCERSEAIHLAAQRKTGLLRRFAPLRRRFAFVAGNDGGARASRHCEPTGRANARRRAPRSNPCLSVIASAAKQSISPRKERLDCFVAALPCANASRLSQAMTEERALPVIACQRVARMRADGLREAIQRLNLTQEEFAARFHLPLGTVRDWEQGAHRPDKAAQVLLTVIARDPEAVARALES